MSLNLLSWAAEETGWKVRGLLKPLGLTLCGGGGVWDTFMKLLKGVSVIEITACHIYYQEASSISPLLFWHISTCLYVQHVCTHVLYSIYEKMFITKTQGFTITIINQYYYFVIQSRIHYHHRTQITLPCSQLMWCSNAANNAKNVSICILVLVSRVIMLIVQIRDKPIYSKGLWECQQLCRYSSWS